MGYMGVNPCKNSLKAHSKNHPKLNPILVSCSINNEIFYMAKFLKHLRYKFDNIGIFHAAHSA